MDFRDTQEADVSTTTMVSIRATASGITKSAVLTVLP